MGRRLAAPRQKTGDARPQEARRRTRAVQVGGVTIGGGAPISVQSMTNTDTRDPGATVAQIARLEEAGCEIVRVAVPDMEAAKALGEIKKRIRLPLVADIHFNYKLALEAIAQGVDKLRINPGNIGERSRVEAVVKAARERGIPIRVGVNAGSLSKPLREKYGHATATALVESAREHLAILENLDFHDIVISLKASDVPTAIEAYQMLSSLVDYPLHVGITEAGTQRSGTIKSAVGIGSILSQGIGDTIRVSLTGDPVTEVHVGFEILKALNLRERGPVIISCPTCGRCGIDLAAIAAEVEDRTRNLADPVRIAVMGCVVNGPGEAQEADIGIAGGKGEGLVFRGGEIVRKVKADQLVSALMEELEVWRKSRSTT